MCIPAAHSCNWCFPGCRVRTGLLLRRLQPHLSVIRISALNLHCGVGREGFSEPLGQGWVPEWEQDWEHGHSLSLVALAAPLVKGKLRHELPWPLVWGGKSESGTLSVVFLYHLFIFSHAPEALLFCKPRVFRNKREGGSFASAEILRVPFETEPALGARWLCCHCHLPLSACRDEAEMSPEAGRDNPALSLLGQAGCGQGGESLPQGAPGQGAGTWWGGESKTNFRASPSTLSLSASESPSPPCLQNH